MDRARAIAVEFAGPAALTMRGLRSGEGDRWAVLVHGEGRDLDGWRPLAGSLADRGFSVLAIDLPGHGASDDRWESELAVPVVVGAIEFGGLGGCQQLHVTGEGVCVMEEVAGAAV